MSKKKLNHDNCRHCCALNETLEEVYFCGLGFKVKMRRSVLSDGHYHYEPVPLENCPKPLTEEALESARQTRIRG